MCTKGRVINRTGLRMKMGNLQTMIIFQGSKRYEKADAACKLMSEYEININAISRIMGKVGSDYTEGVRRIG